MNKQCLCQLCSCGKHKCKKKHFGPAPCDNNCISEYRNTYVRKPIGPPKSCKPDQSPLMSDAPAEDKTTTRVDYVRHAVKRPELHNPDPYVKPAGEMDGLTCYRKEYNRKPLNPPAPFHKPTRRVPGAFDGTTTSRTAYQRWNLPPKFRHQMDVYEPPADPFDGLSSYRTAYVGRTQPVRPSMKPDDAAHMSAEPLDDLTTCRAAYIRHHLPDIEPKEKRVWLPNPAGLDDLTNYRKEYTRKGQATRKSCKPDTGPAQTDAPFVGDTTQRSDYTRKPAVRPELHNPDPYVAPEGPMSSDTTNRCDFDRKPLVKTPAWRPKDRRRPAGQFENMTSHRADFQRWGHVEPVRVTMKDKYEPIAEPFDGMATYTAAYVRHNQPVRPSMKPDDSAAMSDAPLQDHTEYRYEYQRKSIPPCIAGALQSGRRCGGQPVECFEFVETDPAGHDWYKQTPGGEEVPVA